MKKGITRFICALSAVVLFTGALAGCGSSADKAADNSAAPTTSVAATASTAAASQNGIDTSKEVELQFYMLGNAPRDLEIIQTKVNELARKDLNCTVKFNYTTWSDTNTKYNLLLSSGQPIDLMFTADWMNYNQYAKKGAFKPLDEVVPKAAPDLWKWIPENYWNGCKVEGKIYTIPATWKEYVPGVIVYREDLRKKYGTPEVKDITSLEAYLEAIKKNEPNMIPTEELVADWGIGGPGFTAWGPIFEQTHTSNFGATVPYGLYNDYKSPSQLIDYWGSDEFINDMKTLRRWQEKGFWSKSALSTKEYPADEFENGKIASVMASNPGKYATTLSKVRTNHPDWEVGYLSAPEVAGYVEPVHPIHNGFAVPKSSENPERAVAFYSKMVLDKTYNYLTEYGIEGKNYKITEDGHYEMIGDTTTNGFAREAMNGWAWRNPEIQLFDKSFDAVLDIFKKYEAGNGMVIGENLFGGFVEDYAPYQAERTALYQVQSQYLVPLMGGFVADVDKGAATFREKAKGAGLEKIQAEFTNQWQAYCKSIGK